MRASGSEPCGHNRLARVTPTGTENGSYDAQDRVEAYGDYAYSFDAAGCVPGRGHDDS